jgi:hypothetical protein
MNEEQKQIIEEIKKLGLGKTLVERLEASFEGTETENKDEWVNGQPKERPNQN